MPVEHEVTIARLRDRRAGVRAEALRALAVARHCETAVEAVRLLRDPSPRVRDVAVWILGSIGNARHATLIARRLRDPDAWTRCHAVEALGHLGARRFAHHAARLLSDRNWLVRAHALVALGDLESRRHERRIARLLHDPKPAVCATAAMSLAMLGSRRYLHEILALLRHPICVPHAVTALDILRDLPLYRRLRRRRVSATRDDALGDVLGRFGVSIQATRTGRRWLARRFMEFRRVDGYDLYRIMWDVAADFGPGGMGYVVRDGGIVVTDMDEAVAELREWARGCSPGPRRGRTGAHAS